MADFGVERQFGFVPQFVHATTGLSYQRLSDAATAARQLTLDCKALNVFLRTGLFLAGTTPFREIRRISPPPVVIPPVEISREAAIDGYIDLFRQAVTRRVRHNGTVLGLSGGHDSRHIALELYEQRALPKLAVTVHIPGRAAEVAIAKRLADQLGIDHVTVAPVAARAVEDEVWKNLHSDFMAMGHRWFTCAARKIPHAGWWDGIGGDVLSAGLFLEPWNLALFRAGRLDELAERICDEPLGFIWQKDLFPRDEALAAVRAELANHVGAANPVGSFYFWNRTRVMIGASAFGMLNAYGQPTLAPYLDRDLWRFLSALPAELLIDKRLHSDAILTAYPAFASVPFFEGPYTDRSNVHRLCGLSLLAFAAKRPRLWRPGLFARIVRALLIPSQTGTLDTILSNAVYEDQLQLLLQPERVARSPAMPEPELPLADVVTLGPGDHGSEHHARGSLDR